MGSKKRATSLGSEPDAAAHTPQPHGTGFHRRLSTRHTGAAKFVPIFALAMAFTARPLHAAFRPGMTQPQIQAEVTAQLGLQNSAQAIAEDALAAGLPTPAITAAMLNAGIPGDDTVEGMIKAGGFASATTVIATAVEDGVTTNTLITSGAFAAGVPQSTVNAAIASVTVVSGHLEATNTSGSATGTNTVAVNSGNTLSGTGIVTGRTTLGLGGQLAPGLNTTGPSGNFGGVGTLHAGTAGGLSLSGYYNGGAHLNFDLTLLAAGAGGTLNDQIATAGLTLGPSLLFTFNGLDGALDVTAPYTLIATTGAVTGFDTGNISTELLGPLNGLYTATYSVDVNNDLVVRFSSVPEPTTWTFLAGGIGLLLGCRRAGRRLVFCSRS
jgi:hypothetical protein